MSNLDRISTKIVSLTFFFSSICIYLKGRGIDRHRHTERPSIHQFTLQMPARADTGQQPGAPTRTPTWRAGTQTLQPSPAASWSAHLQDRREVELSLGPRPSEWVCRHTKMHLNHCTKCLSQAMFFPSYQENEGVHSHSKAKKEQDARMRTGQSKRTEASSILHETWIKRVSFHFLDNVHWLWSREGDCDLAGSRRRGSEGQRHPTVIKELIGQK